MRIRAAMNARLHPPSRPADRAGAASEPCDRPVLVTQAPAPGRLGMRLLALRGGALAVLLATTQLAALAVDAPSSTAKLPPMDGAAHVKAMLSTYCVACHGPQK